MTGRRALVASALLALAVLALDATTELGTGVATLYAIPLLLVSYAAPPQLSLVAAAVVSVLIVGRAVAGWPPGAPVVVVVNRSIALLVAWATAVVAGRLRQARDQGATSARDLADVKYALDQSAIVATTDARGVITYVNDTFCAISKYTRDELIGRDHRILNSGLHPKEFMRNLWFTIGSGRIWRGEIRNRAKDGSIYWVDTTIVPFLNPSGKPYQYMAIRYEITARKKSEELLRNQAALTQLGEMAAVVAHEVKNPIAGIRGALQVIMSRMPAENRDRLIMTDIVARLDSLNAIVQDLLVFAQPRQPNYEAIEVGALVETTIDLLRRDPAIGGVSFRVSGGSRALSGDRDQLRILLQNLLLNAAQAMKGRGDVDVALHGDAAGCRITIRDHGPGIQPEVVEKAFDAFFTTKHRGTGLGLAIARRVAEAHGGQIALDPADGGGTVASVWLPFDRAAGA